MKDQLQHSEKGIKYPLQEPYSLTPEEISENFKSGLSGLSNKEARTRNEAFGLNAYKAQKQKSLWIILFEQFKNPIVYLLFFGSAVSFYFEDLAEGIAILAVIVINAIVGFFMEFQARRSMNALKSMDVNFSKVYRDGLLQEIPSETLTIGDLVYLESGDVVPADGRLVENNHLQCDESALTGESMPVDKSKDLLNLKTPLAEQFNMVFKGTSVLKGNAKVIITGIGLYSELGKIAALVENSEETATPLDQKLEVLTKKLIWLTLFITAIFIVTGLLQGKEIFLIIQTAIALAVAAIPEGLPIVATLALAYGMLQMAKKNAIVKKLSSVETLGGTNVILTDKTGTLTENKIYVNSFYFPEENIEARIDPEKKSLEIISGNFEKSKKNYEDIIKISALCNNAEIKIIEGEIKEIGDPLEIALIRLVETSSYSIEKIKEENRRISEKPFSSESKMMATLHKNGNYYATAKGSVEEILKQCDKILLAGKEEPLTAQLKSDIISQSETSSADGLRVLGFAFSSKNEISKDDFTSAMTYVGMIGFIDPPRMEVRQAILACKEAGIRVVMATGDHPKTGLNIAHKVGLAEITEKNVMTGADFPENDVYTDQEKARILNTSVFARVTPKQKLDVITLHQEKGDIVAMAGDGVNDAPAIKKADIGVAMGLRGTQVAKETADIILKDDSFVSIAEAVAYGRVIFQNIQKFVVFLISCNLSEIFIVTLIGFILPASTLLPLQILLLNMVTDVFPALALGMGKGNDLTMKRPPRNPQEPIISKEYWQRIFTYAIIISLCVTCGTLFTKYYLLKDSIICNNVAFFSLALAQLWHVLNMSSRKTPVFNNEITKNPFIWWALLICFGIITGITLFTSSQKLFNISPVTFDIWLVCTITSLMPLVIIQIMNKGFSRK